MNVHKKARAILVLVSVSLFFGTCRKEETKPGYSCKDYDPTRSNFFEYTQHFNNTAPSVNPLNTTEFCYLRQLSSGDYELRIHNLSNGYNKVVLSGFAGQHPVWARDGKIYFITDGNKVSA